MTAINAANFGVTLLLLLFVFIHLMCVFPANQVEWDHFVKYFCNKPSVCLAGAFAMKSRMSRGWTKSAFRGKDKQTVLLWLNYVILANCVWIWTSLIWCCQFVYFHCELRHKSSANRSIDLLRRQVDLCGRLITAGKRSICFQSPNIVWIVFCFRVWPGLLRVAGAVRRSPSGSGGGNQFALCSDYFRHARSLNLSRELSHNSDNLSGHL